MNGKLYWKQKLPLLFLNLLCGAGLTVFLYATGNSTDSILLILGVWSVILAAYCVKSYDGRNRQMRRLLELAGQLEERYLLAEVMEKPECADDQVYYQLLKMAGKSMLEQVGAVRRERAEYREYVEQWVHEIKTPITAMKLLCENHRSELTKELLVELKRRTVTQNRLSIMPTANTRKRTIPSGKYAYLMLSIRQSRRINICFCITVSA